MQKIIPCLWFDGCAEAAVEFYCGIFKNSSTTKINRYGEGAPFEKGTAMTISFNLDGNEFIALNGGPMYSFTPAISLVKNCESQEEIDYYWDKLSAGGSLQHCGWLTDKYGVSWQIVPSFISNMLSDPDDPKSQRVITEILKMVKLDIDALKRAYDGV